MLRQDRIIGRVVDAVGNAEQHGAADFTQADWQRLRDNGNVRVAVELAEIGEDGLADEVLRHQARIGDASQYQPLTRLARDLGLPSTQLWMAYNAPYGGKPEPATRFPTPKWTPVGGWKVDPALVYAHTLQESVFRTSVVSPAGARGLMQIMPAAAKDHADDVGYTGNANPTAPHLHFAISETQPGRGWWEQGRVLNPFDYLASGDHFSACHG